MHRYLLYKEQKTRFRKRGSTFKWAYEAKDLKTRGQTSSETKRKFMNLTECKREKMIIERVCYSS